MYKSFNNNSSVILYHQCKPTYYIAYLRHIARPIYTDINSNAATLYDGVYASFINDALKCQLYARKIHSCRLLNKRYRHYTNTIASVRRVHPKNYAHWSIFGAFCFAWIRVCFTHSLQDYFMVIGAIVWLSYMKKDFDYPCHVSVDKSYKL